MPAIRVFPLWMLWDRYILALDKQKGMHPFANSSGFAALNERGDFLAGACIYPADRLVVAEFLVTNPDVPMWERHHGVVELARAFKTYGVVANKVPMVMVRHRGVARAIARAGFASNGAMCFTGQP